MTNKSAEEEIRPFPNRFKKMTKTRDMGTKQEIKIEFTRMLNMAKLWQVQMYL